MATFSSTPTAAAFTSYSSFFSSGLLAPHTPHRLQRRGTFSSDTSEGWAESDSAPPSPSQRSSPGIPLPDESVMDIDMADFTIASKDKDMERRSATPTPHALTRDGSTTPIQSPRVGKPAALRHHPQSQSQPQMEQAQPQTQQPRLRRRRSSLTQGTSPMGAIRSPTRAAGNAYHLQMASRTRSGSLGGDASVAGIGGGYHTRSSTSGVASEATSLVGRMRSGSCSNLVPESSGAVAPVAPSTARYVGLRSSPAVSVADCTLFIFVVDLDVHSGGSLPHPYQACAPRHPPRRSLHCPPYPLLRVPPLRISASSSSNSALPK